MVHYQSALQEDFVFDVNHSHSPCSHLIHTLQPRQTWNVIQCVYKHRTVSKAPGDHLQPSLPYYLIYVFFFLFFFSLWPSLGNRMVTEQRAKEQLKNRPPAASALRAVHRGSTAISNKEWCSVILHKHIVCIFISILNYFLFLNHKRETLVLNACILKIYTAIIGRVYETPNYFPIFHFFPFKFLWISFFFFSSFLFPKSIFIIKLHLSNNKAYIIH